MKSAFFLFENYEKLKIPTLNNGIFGYFCR